MPATATQKPAPAADAIASLSASADAQAEAIHVALFRLDPLDGLPPDLGSACRWLGSDAAIARARRDAIRGAGAVREFRRTEGAAERASKARTKLEKEAPALREQIAALTEKLRQLEEAPVRHERDAKRHAEALTEIRGSAPAYIRQRYRAQYAEEIRPMLKELARLKQEHRHLDTLINLSPNAQDVRHIVEQERDEHGQQPWTLVDDRGRRVVQPALWIEHLRDINAEARRDELAVEVEDLQQQVDEVEATLQQQLDFWLHIESEG
ncbi:MAG: hypothetical protein WD316_08560 [Phycisphaeraceae bacterium]